MGRADRTAQSSSIAWAGTLMASPTHTSDAARDPSLPPGKGGSPSAEEDQAPRSRRGMRTGFTTGACATAAAKAATQALVAGKPIGTVTIHLPAGVDAT